MRTMSVIVIATMCACVGKKPTSHRTGDRTLIGDRASGDSATGDAGGDIIGRPIDR